MHKKLIRGIAAAVVAVAQAGLPAGASAPTAIYLLDPASGNYVITYTGDDDNSHTTIFEPDTKLSPMVSSQIQFEQQSPLRYRYRLTNATNSKQDIHTLMLSPISDLAGPALIRACGDPERVSALLNRAGLAGDSISKPSGWRVSINVVDATLCAANYAESFQPPESPLSPLYINDASLPWGGVFDLDGTWIGPHRKHEFGKDVDIRANNQEGSVPEYRLKRFIKDAAALRINGKKVSVYADIHCRIPPPSGPQHSGAPYCRYSGGEVEGTRHFHVRLLKGK